MNTEIITVQNVRGYIDDRQVTVFSGRKIFGEPHIIIELEELT